MEKYDFKRKDNYSETVLQRVRKIAVFNSEKDAAEGILFVPNKDCIKGYYKGLVLFERITDRCEKLDKRSPEKEWDDHQDIILKVIGDGLPRDKERRTQQIIALNNMTFSNDHYSVCGFETTISTLDVDIPGKKGGPEIDLVIVNPKEKRIFLVEYKCKGSSMLKGNQNIVNHFRDYSTILGNTDFLPTFKQEMLKAYKLLKRINTESVSNEEEDLKPEEYDVKMAFLFVDKIDGTNRMKGSEITPNEYKIAWEMLKGKDLSDVYYIRRKKVEDVTSLDGWKPLADSKFEITE